MTSFSVGDHIVITSQTYPNWDGKRGIIKSLTHDGYIAKVVTDNSKEVLVELLPEQITKINKDPALEKFLTTTLPIHDVSDKNAQTNLGDEQQIQKILEEVYSKGFLDGYLLGNQDVWDEIDKVLRDNGLIPQQNNTKKE